MQALLKIADAIEAVLRRQTTATRAADASFASTTRSRLALRIT